MPLDKPCIAPGCKKDGLHGRGSLLKGTIVWACPEHRDLLERKSEPPAPRPAGKPVDLLSYEVRD